MYDARLSTESLSKLYRGRTQKRRSLRSEKSADFTASARYVYREVLRVEEPGSSLESPSETSLLSRIRAVEYAEGEELSEREREEVLRHLKDSFADFGLLTPLIENESVNDIIVSAYDDISVQIDRKNVQSDLRFPNRDSYLAFVEQLLKRTGKACTRATPVVDVAIDPHIRVCVTHQSFSPPGCGPMLTLRIARHKNLSLEHFALSDFAPMELLQYLAILVRDAGATILISGEVGCGKTSLLAALANEISEEEAILLIEDTHEIALDRPFVRTLLTREANSEGGGRIEPARAIKTGLRMAMNRIILGEMRDAEAAEAYLDVCASGHPGICTIHARSERDALYRLELFLCRVQGGSALTSIRGQIANAIDAVIHLGIDAKSGIRRVRGVSEVVGAAEGVIQLAPIFQFEQCQSGVVWTRGGGLSRYEKVLQAQGCVLGTAGEHCGAFGR